MPKILRILNRLNVGGPTYNVAYLSKFISSEYTTKILVGIKEPFEASSAYMLTDLGLLHEVVPRMHRPLSIKNDFAAYRNIKTQIAALSPDIVHTHAAKAGALGRLAAHFAKKRPKVIVHTYHGNVFDGYFSPLKTKIFLIIERYLCSISDGVIAISEKQKKDLVEKYKLAPAEKVHVVKLGFDLEKFRIGREQKRNSFREHYQITDDTVVVSIVGRLTAVKNHAMLIDAIAHLKQHSDLKTKFFIVGDGELLEPIVTALETNKISYNLANGQNFSAQVIFTSWRKDIDVINAGSDIIALTSLNEGTPVSIIEALASKKAVICTNVGGISDVVKNGFNGILTALDSSEFVEKLRQLIMDKALRDELAANGEVNIFEQYSYTRLVADIESLYEQLLKK